MLIDCQVWAGSFDDKVLYPPHSSQWILHKDFGKWQQSRIHYSHLLRNSSILRPTESPKSPQNQLLHYLKHERACGPHLWIEIKVPTGTQSSTKNSNLLAIGVLPLVDVGEPMYDFCDFLIF